MQQLDMIRQTFNLININNRVCPVPRVWNRLHQVLLEHHAKASGSNPEPPLILSAWQVSSDHEKTNRLEQQIQWAVEHNMLEDVYGLLSALEEAEWYHCDE